MGNLQFFKSMRLLNDYDLRFLGNIAQKRLDIFIGKIPGYYNRHNRRANRVLFHEGHIHIRIPLEWADR